jgi:hypothetical protein
MKSARIRNDQNVFSCRVIFAFPKFGDGIFFSVKDRSVTVSYQYCVSQVNDKGVFFVEFQEAPLATRATR